MAFWSGAVAAATCELQLASEFGATDDTTQVDVNDLLDHSPLFVQMTFSRRNKDVKSDPSPGPSELDSPLFVEHDR